MSPRSLLVATSNAHKTEEIAAMLGVGWRVDDLRTHPRLTSPEEDGDTFEANACIKAEAASAALPGVLVLSDDSGLEVDALGKAPGVTSARYAGAGASNADNRARLKVEMQSIGVRSSTARFRCCMALARDGVSLATFSGAVEGRVIDEERGEGGFGYDSMFIPDGFEDTFGVLSAQVKNGLSHRARALAQVIEWLRVNEQE
jgi:XTP/dITP diphosphohydrolase